MENKTQLSYGIQKEMFEGNMVASGITEDGVTYETFETVEEFPDSGFWRETVTKYQDGAYLQEIRLKRIGSNAQVLLDSKSSKVFNSKGVEVSSTVDEISLNGSEHTVTELVKSPDGKKNVSYFRKVRVAGSDKYDFHRINYKNGIPSEEIRVSEGNMTGSVTLFDKDGNIEKRSVTRNVGGFEIKAIYDSAGRVVSHTKTPLTKAS